MTIEPQASLATLRRLYHHVLAGGRLNSVDLSMLGGDGTLGNIERLIRRMEAIEGRRAQSE